MGGVTGNPAMIGPDPGGSWSTGGGLSPMLFLAGLLHGVLILGVTFQAVAPERNPAATSLEVVLVTREHAATPPPKNPVSLVAEQNLIGRGNAPADARLRTAIAADPLPAAAGLDQDGGTGDPGRSGETQPSQARLAAAARERPELRPGETGMPQPALQRQLQARDSDATDILVEPDELTRIPDANPRELLVSANTREDRIASYLNGWKSRVERIGTLNFPGVANLGSIRNYPVLEVAIKANGELKEIVVRNSSGYPNLDQAAMEILRIAAPFEPFPQMLRDDYDVLRFAYEWHFGTERSRGRIRTISGG